MKTQIQSTPISCGNYAKKIKKYFNIKSDSKSKLGEEKLKELFKEN